MSRAYQTDLVTSDGRQVYDLEPQSGELCAVAGPAGVDPAGIDMDDLPAEFRWVSSAEWSEIQQRDEPCLDLDALDVTD